MLATFLSRWVGRVIKQMRFPMQGEGGQKISDLVLHTFREGCEMGLQGHSYEIMLQVSQSLPWHLRAFFHEGHAMGTAGRHACSLRKVNPERSMKSTNFQVMRFVGYGFWNGVAATYPTPRIPERKELWSDVPVFEKYHLLMSNGLGFSTVLFAGKFDQRLRKRFLAIDDVQQRDAIFHGVGRVLWFLYLNNFKALQDILTRNDDIVEPLTIGLGLAIAFTQVATPDMIKRALDQFPDGRRRHLMRGVGIAFQVHGQNDPECKDNIEKKIAGEMRDWYEGACHASDEAGNVAEWYPKYHELTKRLTAMSEVFTK
ncbi:MAG: DUF1702 family protein [Ignavibacteria bacterium]|nr:DUF1702 family protein [Ignavibacteria bacterium]